MAILKGRSHQFRRRSCASIYQNDKRCTFGQVAGFCGKDVAGCNHPRDCLTNRAIGQEQVCNCDALLQQAATDCPEDQE